MSTIFVRIRHLYVHVELFISPTDAFRTSPCWSKRIRRSDRLAAYTQEAWPHVGFHRKYWRMSKSFVWLHATKPIRRTTRCRYIRERARVIGRWRVLEIDGDIWFTRPAKENPREKCIQTKQMNGILLLSENRWTRNASLFRKAIQPRFIPSALDIADRNNLDFYEIMQREKYQ